MNNETRNFAKDVIVAEFNYIANTAFQANEDRAKVSSVYLVAVASLIAAILSSQLNSDTVDEPQSGAFLGFAIIFLIISIFGFLSILQLVRLRLAWRESARAMNAIKQFASSESAEAREAMLWTDTSLPPAFKPNSVSFVSALQVATISGVMCGASIMYVGFINAHWWWTRSVILGFFYSVLQISIYRYFLRRNHHSTLQK